MEKTRKMQRKTKSSSTNIPNKYSRSLPQKSKGRLPRPIHYPSKHSSMSSLSNCNEEENIKKEEPIYSKVKKKIQEEFYHSSDSDLSQEEKKIEILENTETKNVKEWQNQLAENETYSEPSDSGLSASRRSLYSSSLDRSSSSFEYNIDDIETVENKNMSECETNCEKLNEESKLVAGVSGFGHLPSQVYSKAVRKGFEFSLMVAGASGLGKSTLVNSMFLQNIFQSEEQEEAETEQTSTVEPHHATLEENGVKLSLTVIDTPGFGEKVDNSDGWVPIVEYIEEQFEKYLEEETRITRVKVPDTRVHACLYFIAPTGHGLKPLDIEVMTKIHNKVNIIPVIGKADSCTQREISSFKTKILLQLEKYGIRIYDFPTSELEPEHHWMRDRLPFGVVGSNTVVTDQVGNKWRGRKYPWGVVNIEDKDHCDFLALRNLLLAHHMEDLKEATHSTHYEKYRCEKLKEMIDLQVLYSSNHIIHFSFHQNE